MDMSNISSSSPSLSASVFKDPGVVAELVVTPEELVGARLFPPSIFTEEDTAGNERKEQNKKKTNLFFCLVEMLSRFLLRHRDFFLFLGECSNGEGKS